MSNVINLPSTGPRLQLRAAMQRGDLVRVWRGNLEEGSFCGYVAGVGMEFVLLWVVGDQVTFDGLYAMRLCDITEVEAPEAHQVFIGKALALRRIHPRLPRDFPLDAIDQVVRAVADHAAVLGVHVDNEEETGTSYIGRLLNIEEDGFNLQEVTPDAEWLREPSFFAWDEVSTLSYDEPYAQALLDVAGQPPRIDQVGSNSGRG